MFQNGFNHKTIECNNDSFLKILLKSHLPWKANRFYLNWGSHNQPIQSLGTSPRIPKPRNVRIKPINNKAYRKVYHHICLQNRNSKRVSQIKSKALKPSLPNLRQVSIPKWEPNKHTNS